MSRADSQSKFKLDDLEQVIDNRAHETPYEVVSAARQLVANCRQYQRQDRGALLRMAGNIAAGLANADCVPYMSGGGVDHARARRDIAKASVQIARDIIAEVDKS